MVGGERFSVELTISVKVPCQECGGRGYVETVTGGGRIVSDPTDQRLPVAAGVSFPEDMPLSQFREPLASHLQ
jgi:hypothetical protein